MALLQVVARRARALPLCLLLALFLLPSLAHANSAPPSDFRFDFVYETREPVTLEGAQLVTCQEEPCAQPILLGQFGDCSAAACLPLPADPVPEYPLRTVLPMECSQESCRADASEGYGSYYLVLQFSDSVRVTRTFDATRAPYVVRVQEQGVLLRSPLDTPYRLLVPLLLFVPALLFTILVEGAVIALLAPILSIPRRRFLLWLLPIHLATLPLVWFLFPAFSWSPPLEAQLFGPAALGMVPLLLVAIELARRGATRARWALFALVAVGLLSVLLYLGSRGALPLPTLDLPPAATTALAELAIFLVELWVWRRLGRGAVGWGGAAALSLLANGTSYLLGEALLWLLRSF